MIPPSIRNISTDMPFRLPVGGGGMAFIATIMALMEDLHRPPSESRPAREKIQTVHIAGSIPLPVYLVGGAAPPALPAQTPTPSPAPTTMPPAAPLPSLPTVKPTAIAQPSTPTSGLPSVFYGPWNTMQNRPPQMPDWQGQMTQGASWQERSAPMFKEMLDRMDKIAESFNKTCMEISKDLTKPEPKPGLGESTEFTPAGFVTGIKRHDIQPRAVPLLRAVGQLASGPRGRP